MQINGWGKKYVPTCSDEVLSCEIAGSEKGLQPHCEAS